MEKTNGVAKYFSHMKAHINIPKLSEEQRQWCEERITTEECGKIKETFQNNKSSGNDGLPVEIYKSSISLVNPS